MLSTFFEVVVALLVVDELVLSLHPARTPQTKIEAQIKPIFFNYFIPQIIAAFNVDQYLDVNYYLILHET